MTDTPPSPEEDVPGWNGRRLSFVWLVPLLALVIALAVAWRSYSERGPLIEIVFDNAAGIEEGETVVRYRDVTIGVVEMLGFTEDLRNVIVSVRIDKDIARYLDESAKFWVVRPRLGPEGVTGIETVISGVYIEADWDNDPGERVLRFNGLAKPPLTSSDQPGLRVRLRAPEGGSLSVGSPVLFKQIPVGTVETVELSEQGDVMMDVFVDAPHHRRLTSATRFWNASGFSLELGTSGASLNVDSLISLLRGGIAFETVTSGGEPIEAGHVFQLYESEPAARTTILDEDEADRFQVMSYFDGSVQGLQPGANVQYRGIRVGEVTEIQAQVIDAETDPSVKIRATMALLPNRLGIVNAEDPQETALELLENGVAEGLRAQLVSAGLLSSSLNVALVEVPEAEPASLDRDATPYPEIPSTQSDASTLAASAEGVLERVSSLPIEEFADNAVLLLANINALITDEAIRSAPENLGLLLGDLRSLVRDSGLLEAPAQLQAVLASIQNFVDDATRQRVLASLTETLETTEQAVVSIGTAADGFPALMEDLRALSNRAAELPLEEFVTSGTQLVDDLDALVREEDLRALPASADAALTELRALLEDVRTGGTLDNLDAALVSVRQVSEELAAARLTETLETALEETRSAVSNVNSASADLPELIDSVNALTDRAAALPLEELLASGTEVLERVNTLLQTEEIESVPESLSAALDEVRAVLAELREGGAVANVNQTLASADEAAAAITSAADSLPELVAQFSRVAERAEIALGAVSPGSELNRDTLLVIREVRAAAKAVNDLATALERRPSSVLFGR